MDIQQMVDSRIKEIQSRSKGFSGNRRSRECDILNSSGSRMASDAVKGESSGEISGRLPANAGFDFNESCDMSGIVAALDDALARVAEKMIDISEQAAGDYGRLENDILQSRLAVLQSAESVLDIAVSLREKALKLGKEFAQRKSLNNDGHQLLGKPEGFCSFKPGRDRASMHGNGVADLFKRTYR